MANLVEFLVKVKDLASGPLSKIAATGGKSFTQLESRISGVSSRFNRLGSSIQDIDKKLDQLRKSREISLDSRQIRRINQEMEALERRKARLEGSGTGGSGLSGIGGLAAGAMAVAGVAGIGGVISAGMNKTMTETSFEVMAGKGKGKQLSGDLLQYAQDTIYGNEVLQIGQNMLGFGLKAEQVMPSVTKLGDIAMGNAEKFKSLGLVFSQVAAQGKMMGQDHFQFINAGFNPLQVISEKTGKSMGVLKKEMEEGKISFADVAGAIETATSEGGRFFNMTNTIADTAPGKLLGLQGALEGITASIGVGLLEALVPLIDFAQWLVDAPELIYGFAAAIAALTAGIGVWKIVTQWATISQWLLNIAMFWPIITIALLIGAIVALIAKYGGLGAAMNALWTIIKAFCSNVGIAFKDFFQATGYGLELFILKMNEGFQFIGGMIGNVMRALKLAAQFKFGEAKEALTAEIKTKATAEIEELEHRRNSQKKQNLADLAANVATIRKTWDTGSKKGKSAGDIGSMLGGAGLATPPTTAESATKGISNGGVKNITINVGKFFEDLHFQSGSIDEGVKDIEGKMQEMFLRILNSANSAAS